MPITTKTPSIFNKKYMLSSPLVLLFPIHFFYIKSPHLFTLSAAGRKCEKVRAFIEMFCGSSLFKRTNINLFISSIFILPCSPALRLPGRNYQTIITDIIQGYFLNKFLRKDIILNQFIFNYNTFQSCYININFSKTVKKVSKCQCWVILMKGLA
jgi:hypothetical protein